MSPSLIVETTARVPLSHQAAAANQADVLPRVVAGEPGAVELCLDRYGGLVWSLARKHFASREEAEDAVQEAFVALWKNAGRYTPTAASETTFVAMVARRRIIDLVRRSRAARRSAGEATPLVADELPDDSTPPDHGFAVAEEARRARQTMDRLSEEQQRVLRLALGEGRSQSEIAEATGWPIGTVKSHARRGMKRLRELLNDSPSPQSTATKEAMR